MLESQVVGVHIYFQKFNVINAFACILDYLYFHMIFKSTVLQKMLILIMNMLNIQVNLEDLDLNVL